MTELLKATIEELNRRRTSLVMAIEAARCQGDNYGCVQSWLVDVASFEQRITQIGGTFDPYPFVVEPR